MSIAQKNHSSRTDSDLPAIGIARRRLLQDAAMVFCALAAAPGAKAAACASPDANDSGLRSSLHYAESGPDPAQHCSGCSFFSDPKGDCGSCMILNGPVNKNGHCDSWSARS
jgi:hypothetical protein